MTDVKEKNIAINISDCKVNMIDHKVCLERKGYKGSWIKLSTKQLNHDDVEDAVMKGWIELSDTAPNYTKEVAVNIKFAKPTVHGASTPEGARAQGGARAETEKPAKVKKKKVQGAKVSKLSTEEAIKLVQG